MSLATIIKSMGYKSIHAQLLSVPPYAVAAVVTVAVGFIADRTQQRGKSVFLIAFLKIDDLRVLQHNYVSLWHHRLCHAHRQWKSACTVRRCLLGRDGHLSDHLQHDHMERE
jgi:hypothetical protein